MITYKVTVDKHGTVRWYNENGEFHRVDGPAIEWDDGSKHWYLNGNLHRENGPAVERADDGTKSWWLNGKRHRADGPAVEYASGDKEWWVNGKRHYENGPAVEWNGGKQWWLNGKYYSEDAFNAEILKRKSPCAGKVVEVKGVKYMLTAIA